MAYKQSNNNGVSPNPKDVKPFGKKYEDFSSLLAEGENPSGFTAFTPNGVSRVTENPVHKDNYGEREDGDQYRYGIDTVPAQSLQKKKK